MNQNQRILQQLGDELQRTKEEVNNYKNVYRIERDDRRLQEARANMLQIDNVQLQEDKDNLNEQLQDFRAHINAFTIRKGYKKWANLKSPVSRAKRKSQFRRCLDQAMMHLQEVTRARVQLRIGKDDISLVWARNHFRFLRNRGRNILNQPRANNQYTLNDSQSEDDVENEISEPDAFLSDGTWNDVHIKRIIHVMDLFKISHEAYHELRMTSQSILPPLYRIKNIKKTMSTEINSYHHCRVRRRHHSLISQSFGKPSIEWHTETPNSDTPLTPTTYRKSFV